MSEGVKKVEIGSLVVLLVATIATLMMMTPAVRDSALGHVSNFLDWYSIESYTLDSQGRTVPILNSQYENERLLLDFLALFGLLYFAFIKNSGLKDRFGKGPLFGISFVISAVFVGSYKLGIGMAFFPIINYGPFIGVAFLIFLPLMFMLGGKKAHPFVKILVMLIAIGATFLIFNYGMKAMSEFSTLKENIKIPFISQGAVSQDYASRVFDPAVGLSTNAVMAKAKFDEAETHYTKAQDYYDDGKYDDASREINLAEKLNKEGLKLLEE